MPGHPQLLQLIIAQCSSLNSNELCIFTHFSEQNILITIAVANAWNSIKKVQPVLSPVCVDPFFLFYLPFCMIVLEMSDFACIYSNLYLLEKLWYCMFHLKATLHLNMPFKHILFSLHIIVLFLYEYISNMMKSIFTKLARQEVCNVCIKFMHLQ